MQSLRPRQEIVYSFESSRRGRLIVLPRRAGERAELGDGEFLSTRGRRDPSALEKLTHRHPECFQAGAQHFAPLAESSGSDAFERPLCGGGKRLGARKETDHAGRHLGDREERARRDVEQDFRLRQPLNQHRKTPVRLAARRRDEAFGDLALKHQGKALVLVDPVEPAEEQRSSDVVGQISNNLTRRIRQFGRVERERVCGDQLEMSGIGGSEVGKSRETAPIALDRDDPACTGGKQRPGQAAGAGADLDDGRVIEWSGGAGNPAGQIEVEQEILAEPLACGDPVPGDDLPQRRQRRVRGVASQPAAPRLAAISAASRSAAIRLSARALPWPAIANAVP